MKDVKGIELNIGDRVVFVKGKNNDATLETGTITKIYTGAMGRDCCSVDGHPHVLSKRVMKL